MSQGDRQQQYTQLLQMVLDDPQNTSAILTHHQGLLDRDFLLFMASVAVEANDAGREDIAEFLADLVKQLGEALGIDMTQQNRDEEAYLQFLMQLLPIIGESRGNPQVVYPFLQQNLQYLDETLGQVLQQWANATLTQMPQEQIGIAGFIWNFGNLINRFPLGQRWVNLELGILCYEIVLQIFSQHQQPEMWATIQNNLANAYSDRIKGERAGNIEMAIVAYKRALEVYTREAFPQQWAEIQSNLADTYKYRIKGEKAENIEMAITAAEQALEVFIREAFPQQWAGSQNNLANAYHSRIKGKYAENIEMAIIAYKQALEVFTREAFPQQWAISQNNLATVYRDRIKGEKAKNIEEAIIAYKRALKVFTREAFPQLWARSQNNLANAYKDRIKGERAENIETAIITYEQVLEIYTREAFPEQWAETQNDLANAYSYRIKGERAENIEAAITACEQALEIYTREAFPEQWATTQNNLANAYSYRIKGERAENIEAAIAAYEQALEVRTHEAFPEQWAGNQNNLATAYSKRIKGERAENIEVAITACKRALEVYTREAFPEQWATTQNNLATAYSYRIKGERAENIEVAITACERALEVRTREAFPEQWATTQNNLASTYKNRIKGERTENIEAAIRGYQNALTVHTIEANPLNCLTYSRNFGNLYFSEKQWSKAIEIYELAIDAVEVSRNVAVSDQRRQEILAESIQVFANITQSHIELGQFDQALIYAEQSKARNVTELLANRELYPKGDIAPEIIEKLKQLRSQIPTLDRQLQVLESNRNDTNPLTQQAREQISAELKQARSELDAVLKIIQPIDPTFTLTQTVQPITFAEIQALLDEQTAIVEWYVTQEKTFTFLVTKDQTQPILHTVETKIIADAVQKYLELYEQTQRFTNPTAKEKFRAISADLCEALQLNEILAQLKAFDLTKLILIPHRYLHFLPLHALSLADGSCLLDKFSAGVSYAPSCQLLQVLERQEKSDVEHFFAIKNPTEDLLFSELEVEAISDYFPETDILDRHNASESNFRNHPNLEKLSHLHFSCHGTFDFESPLNSALLLNKTADDEDNRLTLAEIFELNLPNCSLVSLSACETGITDLNSLGDEYVGLPSGFIYAGASAVISSLWPVNDLATSILMMKLYQNLRQDSHHVAVALNQAQHWMRTLTPETGQAFLDKISPIVKRRLPEKKAQLFLISLKGVLLKPESDYRHPYYWAAFTAVGI